jgi:xanthine dehydrogenase YagS FAD-binding subunit
VRTTAREFPIADLYRLPTDADRDVTSLAPDELILELTIRRPEASVYLKAMDRKRWAFPLVGVAAAHSGDEIRIALAGVAPIPWLLPTVDALDNATPLPGTAYKVDVARALVRRALTGVGGSGR